MDVFDYDLLINNKQFGIESKKSNTPINMKSNHYHNHYEIYYQMSGDRYYFIGDRTYFIKKGDLVIIDLNVLHKTMHAGSASFERILISFKEDYISEMLKNNPSLDLLSCFKQNINVLRLNVKDQNLVESILLNMINEKENQLAAHDLYLKVLLLELLIFVNRNIENYSLKQLEYANPVHKKISEITRYINSNYGEPITLKQISDHFYISPFYLSRTFREVTGFTFLEYLNSVRIKESQKLLIDTDLNITEISERVGFQSTTSFGRVFKSINNISPLQFRKKHSL
jgi:AraC-like DNA-binding protein